LLVRGSGYHWDRLEAEGISARRDAQEHLFDDAPVQRVGLGHGLERGQRYLPLPGADPRAPIWTLRRPDHDGAGGCARAPGLSGGLMLVALAAEGGPILFRALSDATHTSSVNSARVSIDRSTNGKCRASAFSGLGNGVDCARLLTGGSFRCGLRRGLAHQSFDTTTGGAADSHFNSEWDIAVINTTLP
jgi:hypothetical protein